jgi:hypothetical protein
VTWQALRGASITAQDAIYPARSLMHDVHLNLEDRLKPVNHHMDSELAKFASSQFIDWSCKTYRTGHVETAWQAGTESVQKYLRKSS